MPDEDGLEILRKLRSKPDTKRIPVILISAKSTELDRVRGLEMGADDYITKPFGVMELIARVKALLRRTEEERRVTGKEKYIRIGDIFIDDVRRVVFVADEKCELTYKEYELLKLLVLNEGIVLTRDIIMEKVWGVEFESESRTVDMHIKTLRQKLGEAGKCPVYQNVNAQPVSDPEVIKKNLIAQLTASVRWTQTVQNMLADGASSFLEIGPGNVLQGLIKKVSTEVETAGMQ